MKMCKRCRDIADELGAIAAHWDHIRAHGDELMAQISDLEDDIEKREASPLQDPKERWDE